MAAGARNACRRRAGTEDFVANRGVEADVRRSLVNGGPDEQVLAPAAGEYMGRDDDMVNGPTPKLATDDRSALAQRLSIVEARLGVVEAALRLDTTTEPVASEPPAQSARTIGWLAMVTALIAVVGIASVRARG
jgi:hypothetical protein